MAGGSRIQQPPPQPSSMQSHCCDGNDADGKPNAVAGEDALMMPLQRGAGGLAEDAKGGYHKFNAESGPNTREGSTDSACVDREKVPTVWWTPD